MNKKSIVLLSGGLDSLISLDIASKESDVELALTFDYGQKAFEDEKEASENICNYYHIKHKIIGLPFLAELSDNSLTNPDKNDFNSLDEVWIPNRNGLFLNIAASFADKNKIDFVYFGANKEEGVDFPDNSKEFLKSCEEFFNYSTLNKVKIVAPCVEFDKIDIVNYAICNNVPLNLLKSCYNSSKNTNKKHCGECMSCKLLKNAILKSKKPQLLEDLF